MAYKDLQEFVRILDKHGQLKRISSPVSPELEITEIAD
ncbi:MAG: UbiD family decarboxylase, partial [Armatimonadetes bacterium]|nr:UbiD family decarboxylase [Armatimonadota bacterium]